MTIDASESFPLKWPHGKPRTESYRRVRSAFGTSMSRARDSLLKELKLLGARYIVISTNVETYMRGGQQIPYADQSKSMEDPGVAVYYSWKEEQYCISCDKYKALMDNMQAVNKTIQAIRGIERWGTGDMMKAAFQGFKALPEPPKATIPSDWDILGIRVNASEDEIREAYLNKVKIHHPDRGGNHEMFVVVRHAYDNLMKKSKVHG